MINKAIVIGRVGADPIFKNGVAKFGVATSEKYKDRTGQPVQKTEWHSITAFSKLGEIAEQYIKKGMLLYVEGKMQTSKWQDNQGKEHSRTEIIASSIQMLGSKSNEQGQSAGHNQNNEYSMDSDYMYEKTNRKMEELAVIEETEDDLPF